MRAPLAIAAACVATALAAGAAAAEPLGSHFELSQFGGYTLFDQERNGLTGRPLENGLYLGGRLGWMANRFGIELTGGFSPTREDTVGGADMDFVHGSLSAVAIPYRGARGWPYLSLGYGLSRLSMSSETGSIPQGNAEAAAGIQFWLSDAVGLRVEARDVMWLPKDDVFDPTSHTLIFGGGLTFALGARARDTDGDGVPDRHDECPDTPAGAKVDTKGCPTDADADRVWDGIDQCEGTPAGARVDTRGCPSDADADSVWDGIDQCEGTPAGARVDTRGCPLDTDADGIADGIDQCENTPRGSTVDARGCPIDADNDGVADGVDKCPNTGAGLRVDKDGCPIEVTERETELLDTGMIRMEDVTFETGRATLKPESLPALDVVGQVLSKWPQLRIELGGHTDSRGSAAYNQKLSEDRVRAVKQYLLERFPQLKPEQYTVKGYGESRPLATNTSAQGMARNRRVEFVVLNKEVLKREVERRRLLERN